MADDKRTPVTDLTGMHKIGSKEEDSQKGVAPHLINAQTTDGKPIQLEKTAGGGLIDALTRLPVDPNTIKPGSLEPSPTAGRVTGEYGKVSQIAIDDPDTPGDTKIVPAQQHTKTGQWVTADANRDPLPTPKRIVSTGGSGRQAEAQAMAMINAGNEASASLKNLVELPIGATSGWFKGLTSQTPE